MLDVNPTVVEPKAWGQGWGPQKDLNMSRKQKWHRRDLSLRTVLRVLAMSKSCEPIKTTSYSETERQKWFAEMVSFLKGNKPLTFAGPYGEGYRAARAISARNPKRFLVGYKPQGIGPKKPANTNIKIVSEEFERQMSRAKARAAWSALR